MKKQVWDEFWNKYEKPSKAEMWLIEERERVIEDILGGKKNAKTLEIGCGFASNSRLLNKKGYDAFCLDKSPIVIKKIRKELKNSVTGDAFNLPFDKNKFDLVFSAGLLEHFKNPEGIIREMFRVAKKKGIVLNFVPGKYSLWQMYKIFHGKNWKHGYEESYTHEKLISKTRKAVDNSDFRIIKSEGLDPLSVRGFFLKAIKINIPVKKSISKNSYTEIFQACRKL